MRFKGRQLTQIPNYEIMIDMEHHKHELHQLAISKPDKTKPERLLSTREMTRYSGGVGSVGWLVDHRCPQLSLDLSERRKRQEYATLQDMLQLNKMIRSVKPIECKLKIRSVPTKQMRLWGVHDAANANVDGLGSQQAHVILAQFTKL